MDIAIKKKHPLIRYKYYILAGAVFLGFFIYVLVVTSGPRKLRYDADKLEIVQVTKDKFLEYVEVEGVVKPMLTLKVSTYEAGIVERIVAEDGSSLLAGDTILVLSNSDLQRTINDERDDLGNKQLTYQEKQIQMERATSQLQRQSLQTAYQLNKLEKERTLNDEEFSLGIKSKAQYEVALDEFNYNQKNSELVLNELRHDSLLNTIQIELMQSDLKREEMRFERSRERLDNLVVRAPIDGQLSSVTAVPGDRVGPGAIMGEIKVIDQVKISTKVSEYYIDRIFVGLPATITYQGEKYPLKISKVNPEIRDRNFEVDLVFTDKLLDNVRIGKNYRIQIEMEQPEEAVVIQKGNFFQSTGGQWIFKLSAAGDKATRVPVSIGRQNPKQYEILEGLQPGEQVIVSGYDNFGEAQEIILK